MTVELKVRHIYDHDAHRFETAVNEAIGVIVEDGGVVADIQYGSDPATSDNHRGGFGALIITP